MNTVMDRAEIVLWVRHEDGRWSGRAVWVVALDGDAYVRSAFGRRSAWYRRVLRGAETAVEAGGARVPVVLGAVADPEVVRRVSGAYRAKYGLSWPGPVESMNGPGAAATTMRLTDLGQVPELSA
ncbi:DUF2255 family protein [Streptomyces spectabilis]|uniref:DUF2255 family protein n=1 Tax=Streptomyces spectabilis TaxID=68270 RepID=A0A5P2X185_STRST|nr:DUF2255 family protein [Streptomyces spectabilis]MBB5101449.1 hypothetical protein [Streptomyces spectabilis]MCI3900641.1 DUF2255 family protein [Streptomyces spectabilis]QEV58191.1 DUF2255 family protein [Streptomyces spectabilis]GGV11492.1 hypothetical protein GCM10010245_21330 [Streptomyces spectabilis]